VIWLKRLLPLAVIGLGWLGYSFLDKTVSARQEQEENRLALVTAQVWIATAMYRNDPERYLAYRDSLLKANDIPRDEVFAFLVQREKYPEELLPFAQKVQRLVDSLYHVEDSLAREAMIRAQDSARVSSSGH